MKLSSYSSTSASEFWMEGLSILNSFLAWSLMYLQFFWTGQEEAELSDQSRSTTIYYWSLLSYNKFCYFFIGVRNSSYFSSFFVFFCSSSILSFSSTSSCISIIYSSSSSCSLLFFLFFNRYYLFCSNMLLLLLLVVVYYFFYLFQFSFSSTPILSELKVSFFLLNYLYFSYSFNNFYYFLQSSSF